MGASQRENYRPEKEGDVEPSPPRRPRVSDQGRGDHTMRARPPLRLTTRLIARGHATCIVRLSDGRTIHYVREARSGGE